jgi:hypothetical protein
MESSGSSTANGIALKLSWIPRPEAIERAMKMLQPTNGYCGKMLVVATLSTLAVRLVGPRRWPQFCACFSTQNFCFIYQSLRIQAYPPR